MADDNGIHHVDDDDDNNMRIGIGALATIITCIQHNALTCKRAVKGTSA